MKKLIPFILIIILFCSCQKKDEPEVSDGDKRKVITMSGLYNLDTGNNDIAERIFGFNNINTEYKLVYNSYQDYTDPVSKYNMDIISGEIPDIVFDLNSDLPLQSYAEKGVFTDLYEFMDGDPYFNEENYLFNAFTAMETNGKLYGIFPNFRLEAIMLPESKTDGSHSWTIPQFIDYIEDYPEAKYVIGAMTRERFLTIISQVYFKNDRTGEYNFNADDFKMLLDLAERFPADNGELDDHIYSSFSIRSEYERNNLIAPFEEIFHFRYIKGFEELYLKEKAVCKGLPNPYGNGIGFIPTEYYGITSGSGNEEGAWEFIKYILNAPPPDISKPGYFGFSVNMSVIEEQMAEAKENPFIVEDGVRSDNPYSLSKKTEDGDYIIVPVGNNTDEDNERIMSVLKSVNYVYREDKALAGIISDEAAAYYSGQKTAGEIIPLIENRVNTYLAERQ